jgi:phosphoesterase RecJ-like protein
MNFIHRYDRFVLSGHIRPDGDSVGACGAMALALQAMGKEAYICLDGDATRYTDLLTPLPILSDDEAQHIGKFAFIMLDCCEPGRTGKAEAFIMRGESSLCIDHHVTSKEYADFNYVESQTTSVSEVLYYLMQEANIPVTKEMAEALFVGVAFDTGGFRHSSTTSATYRMAADLVDKGANQTKLMNALFHTKKFSEARGLSLAIRKAKLYDGCILMSCLSQGDFFQIAAHLSDTDGVVGDLIEIQEAEVAVFMRENEDGTIRVNMRSKESVDVARVAALFGGGGHIRAAGCTVSGPMLLAKEKLLAALRLQLTEQQ